MSFFEKFAAFITRMTGSTPAFIIALLIVVAWAATGPIFHYSETWQLVINTGTTIITFLMVFVIQHAQNKDMRALHLKLNELIAAVEGASNRLIDVEDLTDRELEHLYARFQCLARDAQKVSHGAKLTIDSSDPDGDHAVDADPTRRHDHAESASEKQPVSAKPEARHRKKPRNS